MNDSSQSPKRLLVDATHETTRGMVKACPRKVQRVITNKNLSITAISDKTGLSRNWVLKLKKGESILRTKLEELCEFLGLPAESLLPDPPEENTTSAWSLTPPDGWSVIAYLGPFRQAPNGLSYRSAKLQHKFVVEKLARGKFYDLLHISPLERDTFIAHLTRHPQVCALIGRHPNISENIDARPLNDKSGWWVIDPWIEGRTLEETVMAKRETPNPKEIQAIGKDILQGLSALHKHAVVFRELAPDKVLVKSDTRACVLTDFELAKLSEGAPSVSGTWEPGFFRAPEVSDYDAYPQSDLYSWGRLMIWCLAGGKADRQFLEHASDIPKGIKEVLQQCTHPRYSKRPSLALDVLATWSQWK